MLICGFNETAPDGSPQPAAPTRSVSFDVPGEPDGGMVSLDLDVVAERIADPDVIPR